MSGEYFDYKQYRIEDIAVEIDEEDLVLGAGGDDDEALPAERASLQQLGRCFHLDQ